MRGAISVQKDGRKDPRKPRKPHKKEKPQESNIVWGDDDDEWEAEGEGEDEEDEPAGAGDGEPGAGDGDPVVAGDGEPVFDVEGSDKNRYHRVQGYQGYQILTRKVEVMVMKVVL